MASVSRAFAEVEGRAGLVVGVLPRSDKGAEAGDMPGYPNRWVELLVRTHLGRDGASRDSRNHVNVLTSDVVVALPRRCRHRLRGVPLGALRAPGDPLRRLGTRTQPPVPGGDGLHRGGKVSAAESEPASLAVCR